MKTSIRKFLLVNLLLAITITTLLTVVGNYYLDQKDIQEHVDRLVIERELPYFYPNAESELIKHEQASQELGWRIIIDDLYIMLLTFPLSGLLIWIIISRGLDSLNRVTIEVANRAPSHLEPVSIQAVPEEIRPLIDELNHLFYRLQDGFEREKRFAADAAHELRTPLAAIKTQAQVALNTRHEDEKNAALHKLLASVNRSTHIVQQLLTMSKLVPETHNIDDLDHIELARIVRDILAMMAPVALEKNIEVEFQESPDTPLILGNATALGILLRNLMDNAIRYSPEGTLVLVCVYAEDQHVVLNVSDHGPGIPKELHARVFERFFRILGNKGTGSGLGLAIVNQICAMHHAEISLAKPEKSNGLVVKIRFPMIVDDTQHDA